MENLSKLLESVARLISAASWPGIFLYIVLRYRSEIGMFFQGLSEGSLEAFGVKASAKRLTAVAAVATAQLAHEEAKIDPDASPQTSAADRISSSLASADTIVTARVLRSLNGKRVLWVDDHPIGNLLERQALEALGLAVDTAPSTAAALTKLQTRKSYDLVISDMVRAEGPQAGYDLLEILQTRKINIPFIIYTGSSDLEQQSNAQSKGVFGLSFDPNGLLDLVKKALPMA